MSPASMDWACNLTGAHGKSDVAPDTKGSDMAAARTTFLIEQPNLRKCRIDSPPRKRQVMSNWRNSSVRLLVSSYQRRGFTLLSCRVSSRQSGLAPPEEVQTGLSCAARTHDERGERHTPIGQASRRSCETRVHSGKKVSVITGATRISEAVRHTGEFTDLCTTGPGFFLDSYGRERVAKADGVLALVLRATKLH